MKLPGRKTFRGFMTGNFYATTIGICGCIIILLSHMYIIIVARLVYHGMPSTEYYYNDCYVYNFNITVRHMPVPHLLGYHQYLQHPYEDLAKLIIARNYN